MIRCDKCEKNIEKWIQVENRFDVNLAESDYFETILICLCIRCAMQKFGWESVVLAWNKKNAECVKVSDTLEICKNFVLPNPPQVEIYEM